MVALSAGATKFGGLLAKTGEVTNGETKLVIITVMINKFIVILLVKCEKKWLKSDRNLIDIIFPPYYLGNNSSLMKSQENTITIMQVFRISASDV